MSKLQLSEVEVILIDNFDSFTYNLVAQLRPLVQSLKVYRNDISESELLQLVEQDQRKKVFILSPGPGSPNEAGITLSLLKRFAGKIPILGICLGHQSIIQNFGGTIGAAKSIVHGKAYDVKIDQEEQAIFGELESPFRAARYHSLAATKIPSNLKVIASTDSEVMAVRHIDFKILGFQFHPESILTPNGEQLLKNSLEWLVN